MKFKKIVLLTILIAQVLSSLAQAKYTLSGSVKDAKNGEELIGAIVFIKEIPNLGAITNSYGFFSLTVPVGVYTMGV